jgi:hypothetical protein
VTGAVKVDTANLKRSYGIGREVDGSIEIIFSKKKIRRLP